MIHYLDGEKPDATIIYPFAGRLTAQAFSPDGKFLYVADSLPSQISRIHVFQTDLGKVVKTIDSAHDDAIYDLAIRADGKQIVSASADKLAHVRNTENFEVTTTLEGHTSYVLSVTFSPNGNRIATGGDDGAIKIWDANTGTQLSSFQTPKSGPVGGVFWGIDADNLAAQSKEKDKTKAEAINTDRIVTINDLGQPGTFTEIKTHEGGEQSTGARERKHDKVDSALTTMAYDAEPALLFAGTDDGRIFIWDKLGRKVFEMAAPQPPQPASPLPTISFMNDVLPILTKAGCSAGSCHAKTDGQNGFALTIFSFDPDSDFREIAHNARGRRIFPAAAEHSLLLLKATNQIAHEGDKRFEINSAFYKTIHQWIKEGARASVPGEPLLTQVTVSPPDATYKKLEEKSIKVTAHFSDKSTRDVTGLAEFQSNEEAFAKVDHHGKITAGEVPGDGVIIVRYVDKVASTRVTIPPDHTLPESKYKNLPQNNEIDRLAQSRFKHLGLLPSPPCDDSEFIRRTTLDVLGKLPAPDTTRSFLADPSPKKRENYINALLADENSLAYGDFWATKWGDLLRPNTQRVGVKPVYLFDSWLREKLRANTPWDQLVKELLTATGSSHQYGPVAMIRDKREPDDMAEFVSQLFLGVRLNCARCHHHPSEKWGQDDYYSLAAFFGSLKRKGQGISAPISGLPEYWWFEPGSGVKHPVSEAVMTPKALDGTEFSDIPATTDPRAVLVEWMTRPTNPYFARAIVNRIWGELFGRGIVHPVDDFRDSNPAVNEPLLDWLAAEFARQGFDQKRLLRIILNSQLYQQSADPNETNAGDLRNFSRAYRRRLPAEVLLDAVSHLTQKPETFQGLIEGAPAVQQWNYLMPSDFLDAFGRPDSSAAPPCERDGSSSVVQALHMMNAKGLQRKFSDSKWLAELEKKEPADAIAEIYLSLLSRPPEKGESEIALNYLNREKIPRRESLEDVLWSILNSAEFVFNH